MNTVKKSYNYKGALTSSKTHLECHHLNSWNYYMNERYKVSNGVLISSEIHTAFHKIYGYGNNTEIQFSEFCKNYYGVNWFELKQKIFN